jgi:hypothetical protein
VTLGALAVHFVSHPMAHLIDVVGPPVLRALSWLFGEDTAFYCVFAGPFALMLGVVSSLLFAALAGVTGWRRATRRLIFAWLVILMVFPLGALGNVVFIRYFRDRFYSVGDPFVDFLPYCPMVPYDESFGGRPIHGSTDLTMLLLWLATATPAWLISGLAAWQLRKHALPAN